jgi:hypothetical protein
MVNHNQENAKPNDNIDIVIVMKNTKRQLILMGIFFTN